MTVQIPATLIAGDGVGPEIVNATLTAWIHFALIADALRSCERALV